MNRYSNWPVVDRSKEESNGLINSRRRAFVMNEIAKKLLLDGGPEFVSKQTETFLKMWGHNTEGLPLPSPTAIFGLRSVSKRSNVWLLTRQIGLILTYSRRRWLSTETRSNPTQPNTISSAMHIFGRQIRSLVPTSRVSYGTSKSLKSMLKLAHWNSSILNDVIE